MRQSHRAAGMAVLAGWLGVLFVLSVYFSPPALWASCANPDVSPAKAELHAPYGLARGARVLAGITPYPPA